jgi:hypothetical protein
MRLAWDNKFDAATLTGVGSEIATLPGINVQKVHLSQKWYTQAAINSSFLLFDLGAALTLDTIGVFGTNLTSAATYRLRCSANPDGVTAAIYDSGVIAAGVKTGFGQLIQSWAGANARYWRLDLADASLNQLQIGRVFGGPSWQISSALLWGWGLTVMDDSAVAKSRGGQSFSDSLPKYRALEFTLDYLSEAQIYDNAFALARANGRVKDVLAIPFEAGAYVSEQAVWGLVRVSTPLVHRLTRCFRQQFRIEERL